MKDNVAKEDVLEKEEVIEVELVEPEEESQAGQAALEAYKLKRRRLNSNFYA